MSVTHYNNELGEVVEYEMLDPPQCLAEMTPLSKNIGLQDDQAEELHLRKPIKTYKHKNNYERNNTSWEQIWIGARET